MTKRRAWLLIPVCMFSVVSGASYPGAATANDEGPGASELALGVTRHPDLPAGYVLVEGDIQVREEDFEASRIGGRATYGGVSYWAGGVVPYQFSTTGGTAVSAGNQQNMLDAMGEVSDRAGVTFREFQAGDPNWILIQNSNVNSSAVGVQGGQQIVNIASWGTQITIVHELYHALGFWHEQSRPDRGDFVTINTNNICGSGSSPGCTPANCCLCVDTVGNCIPCAFNFNTQSSASTYGPYDFDSFMHYGRAAFSCNFMDTITVNDPFNAQWQNTIGQRDHFSFLDGVTCRGVYPFVGDRWLDQTHAGAQSGTFFNPWNLAVGSAINMTPGGGTLFVQPGTYSAVGVHDPAVTIRAPLGGVILGD